MNALSNVTLGRYFPGRSFLHQLDPRCKLFTSWLLMAAVFAITRPMFMLLFFCLVLLLFKAASIPWRYLWKGLHVFLWLYVITFAIHLFSTKGRPIFALSPIGLTASYEGLAAGVLFTVRIAALILLGGLLMALTMPQDMADGIERWLRPLARLGLPVSEGALTISIALRFVPILFDEAERIRRSQLSRGADFGGHGLVRVRRSLPLIVPLFAGALKRADDLAVALQGRAYQGGKGRTQLTALQFRGRDTFALGLTLVIAAGFWVLR